MVIGILPPSLHLFFHYLLIFLLMLQETFLTMLMCPLLLRRCTVEMDSELYEMARALDYDDDRPIGELMKSDVEMLRRIFLGRCDPRVH